MKNAISIMSIFLFCISTLPELYSQNGSMIETDSTIIDYDGNVYHTISLGDQVWLKENLSSVHYSDGTPIPGVLAYNNSDSLANIYGMLYTWDAAMNNSTTPGVQGVCPCGWHVPTDAEWKATENFLGGASVAGGAMKDAGAVFWQTPNTGATNSSGLTILPAGEYDGHSSPKKFQLLDQYAVFWTSTQISNTKAREKYLSFDNAAVKTFDWFKDLNYSIRCVKNSPTNVEEFGDIIDGYRLNQNFPNPFNPATVITYQLAVFSAVQIKVFDLLGQEVVTLVNDWQNPGLYSIEFDGSNLGSGIYIYRLISNNFTASRKMLLLK
ncbi:MAG: FISUMP domain-containing protein [bacterium]